MNTLLELAEVRAELDPDRVGFTWSTDRGDVAMAYGELVRRSATLASALVAETAPGDRVLIMHPQGRDYVVSLLACIQAGCIAVPAFPPTADRLDRRLDSMVRDADATLGLASSAVIDRMDRATGSRASDLLRLLATDAVTGGADPPVARRPGPDDPAFLQYTSGSTSAPKGVVITHANLLHNLTQIGRRFGHHRDSVGVIWLPPFHDMGLIGGLLAPLHGAFPVTLLTPVSFLRSPARWLQTISRIGGTTSGGPSFAYDLCVQRVTDEQAESLDLSSWTVAFNGAEPVDAAVIDRFTRRFAPSGFRREAFYPCYGLAESTLLVSGGPVGAPPVVRSFDRESLQHGVARTADPAGDPSRSRDLVGCGQPVDDQAVVIVDPDSHEALDEGTVGELWVSGPSVAAGYWNTRPSADPFGRALPGHARRFLRTGDHGFFHEGELFVTGRGSDLLIFRGQNHHPQDIELTVSLAHPDLRPHGGAAFSMPIDGEERLVVVHEVVRAARHAPVSALASAARAAVSDEHGLQLHTLVLVRPGRVPRTTSNKVQRSACREAFLAGDLDPLGVSTLEIRRTTDGSVPMPLDRHQVEAGARAAAVDLVVEHLRGLASATLGLDRDAVDPQRSLAELGIDSVGAIDLLHRIEEELDVSVPPSVAMGSSSTIALASWVVDEIRTGRVHASGSDAHNGATGDRIAVGEDALWILYNLAPESSAYTIAAALRLAPDVDPDRLELAVEELVANHHALRVRFESSERGGAVRRSMPPTRVFRREDASGWSDAELEARTSAVANRPFDLERGPILRFHLFTRGDEHRLVFACHQIAADFWSVELLARELAKRYEHRGHPVEVEDFDAPAIQRRSLHGAHLDRLRSYWAQQLAGPLPRLYLPLDQPRPAVQTYEGATVRLELPADVHVPVRRLAEQEATTPFVVLLSAYSALLARYTWDPDVVVGTPMANRSRELAHGIGFLANTVALRVEVASARSFRALVRQVRRTTLDALDHQAYPFAAVLQDVKRRRSTGRPGVFDTMFTMQQPRGTDAAGLDALALGHGGVPGRVGALAFESVAVARTGSQFDLTLMLADIGDRYAGSFTYHRGLFDRSTIDRFAAQFCAVVADAVKDPSQRPRSLRLSAPEAAMPEPSSWRSSARSPSPASPSVIGEIERVGRSVPDAVAVIDGTGAASFGELLAEARSLRAQVTAAGPREGDPVAVLLPAGRAHLAAMLAILGTRQPYLPLDPAWPPPHVADVLTASGAAAIITDGDGSSVVATHPDLIVIRHGSVADAAASATSASPIEQHLGSTACIYATSGSTGRPKLVAMSHAALDAQVAGTARWSGARADDRHLVVESFAFASSIRQVLVPLSTGGAVVVGREIAGDAPAVLDLARKSGVTVLSAVPSVLRHWADTVSELPPAERIQLVGSVRLVSSASEHLSEAAASTVAACFPDAQMYNLFGHTEVCGIATAHSITAAPGRSGQGDAPIGAVVGAAEALILDDDGRVVPIGVPGILHVGGPIVASGYLGDPAETAAAFVPDPYGPPGSRRFCTGDVVRHRGGSLEFLGRQDGQLKVRGARVDPRAVEQALDSHPGVQASVAAGVVDGDDLRLVAYVESVADAPSASELRRHVAALLPPGSVPSTFVTIDAWPRLPSGKVDRRSLPPPSTARPAMDTVLVLPRTPLEEQLAEIWTSVLPVDVVGVDDNFFDIGGTSLDAMVVHRQLRAGPAPEIRLVTVFQHPTIAALARHIGGDQQASRHMERGSTSAASRRDRLLAMRARAGTSSTGGEPWA